MIKFNEQGFALESGEVTVYVADSQGIFSHQATEFISEGGSLAAGSYLDAPPKDKDGFVIVREPSGWVQVKDMRGTYYDTTTGEKVEITELGEIADTLTKLAPPNPQATWNGKEWEITKKAQAELLAEKKSELLNRIASKADQLKSLVFAGYSTAEVESFYRQEKEALALKDDPTYPALMLTSIANSRGVPLEILAQKVLEKSDFAAPIIGSILGKKQQFEDRIQAVENLADFADLEAEIEQWQL